DEQEQGAVAFHAPPPLALPLGMCNREWGIGEAGRSRPPHPDFVGNRPAHSQGAGGGGVWPAGASLTVHLLTPGPRARIARSHPLPEAPKATSAWPTTAAAPCARAAPPSGSREFAPRPSRHRPDSWPAPRRRG